VSHTGTCRASSITEGAGLGTIFEQVAAIKLYRLSEPVRLVVACPHAGKRSVEFVPPCGAPVQGEKPASARKMQNPKKCSGGGRSRHRRDKSSPGTPWRAVRLAPKRGQYIPPTLGAGAFAGCGVISLQQGLQIDGIGYKRSRPTESTDYLQEAWDPAGAVA